VPADLGLVAHAAERHAHELTVERARDRLADRGLARPGRSDQGQDRARALVLRDATLLAQLAHGQVLDDPLLHVLEARVVGVEDLARDLGVEPLVGLRAPRHGEQPVEVGADHRGLARGVAHALEPAELTLRLPADLVGHLRLFDLLAVLIDDRALVLAELLADRLHLLTQEVLALLGLCPRLDVFADASAHLQLGEPLALQLEGQLEPFDDVDGLQQLDALLEGQVWRVRAGVGQRARLDDRTQELADPRVGVAQLEDLLHDCAVLGLELARLDGRRRLVGPLFDLDVQAAAVAGFGSAELPAVQAVQRRDWCAAGKAADLRDFGDRADAGVDALVPRHEQDTRLVGGVERQGHRHAGEDDSVVQGD
jgi:hypothetical protein